MAVYTIDAHDGAGGVTGYYATNRRDALSNARLIMNGGQYLRVEVTLRTHNGAARHVATIHPQLTAADLAARQALYPKARED